MRPRLLLLTGPAAGEVAQVFSDNCYCLCAEGNQHRTWDEVRDYWDAPRRIAGELEEFEGIEYEIRSLPGGEAWLVGLVLPAHTGCLHFPDGRRMVSTDGHVLPARLAILAPEPPPLLVERVRAWGGEVWECTTDHPPHCIYGKKPCGITARNTGRGDTFWDGDTWPEAVRKALREAPPA